MLRFWFKLPVQLNFSKICNNGTQLLNMKRVMLKKNINLIEIVEFFVTRATIINQLVWNLSNFLAKKKSQNSVILASKMSIFSGFYTAL